HVGEQERASLRLWDAADELQSHQRMELGVLVDRMVDPHQEALGLEVGDVRLQVEARLAAEQALLLRCYDIVHPGCPVSFANPLELSHGSRRPSSSPDRGPSPCRGLMAARWRPPR